MRGVESALVEDLLAPEPGAKERFGFRRQDNGHMVTRCIIKCAVLQERKDCSGIRRTVMTVQPGTQVITERLQGGLERLWVRNIYGHPQKVGKEVDHEFSVEFFDRCSIVD